MEDHDPKKKDKSLQKQSKRTSLTALGAGTKNILAGKFGDAFKRFETNTSAPPPPRTPSPLKELERRDLTPPMDFDRIRDDNEDVLEDADDLSPEMRREIERRRLSQEEKRVAAAAAEYRQRVKTGTVGPTPLPKSIGGVSRAVSIQNKVQSLLNESSRTTTSVTRTAQGYGHYSDAAHTASRPPPSDGRPAVPRKPIPAGSRQAPAAGGSDAAARRPGPTDTYSVSRSIPVGTGSKPAAPPKPTHLNKNMTPGNAPASPPKPSVSSASISVPKLRGRDQIVAADLPGQPALEMSPTERDDYIRDFQARFPSLTAIEMVERDLGAEAAAKTGT
jgi:AP2-associated kinase